MKFILLLGMMNNWLRSRCRSRLNITPAPYINKVCNNLVLIVGSVFFVSSIFAQSTTKEEFPDRPVKFVVPFAPGGPTDIIARILSQKLTALWGQAVVVDNRPGASGNTGTTQVAKSKSRWLHHPTSILVR
jgi:tripartite-type tricarboxylate transporter receptor subunit TctC